MQGLIFKFQSPQKKNYTCISMIPNNIIRVLLFSALVTMIKESTNRIFVLDILPLSRFIRKKTQIHTCILLGISFMERSKTNSHWIMIMEKIKRITNWMQFAFNFTLEKKIFLKNHNNSIKICLFCLYFETKKMSFFAYNLGRREYKMLFLIK